MLNKHMSLSMEQREAVDNEKYILASLAIGQRVAVSVRGCCSMKTAIITARGSTSSETEMHILN